MRLSEKNRGLILEYTEVELVNNPGFAMSDKFMLQKFSNAGIDVFILMVQQKQRKIVINRIKTERIYLFYIIKYIN